MFWKFLLAYTLSSQFGHHLRRYSGVLGLGNVGLEDALAVMEGKSVLFKVLGDINAIPLCIATRIWKKS